LRHTAVEVKWISIAPSRETSIDARAWITQCYLQLHRCLLLPRKRSPDGASPDWGCEHQIAAYSSLIYPERIKGLIGLVGWPTADGLPT